MQTHQTLNCIMLKTTKQLSLATALLLALTACGGGGSEDPNASAGGSNSGGGNNTGSASARELRPLGSPAYFVPDGQNSITINLSNCGQTTPGSSAGVGGVFIPATRVVMNAGSTLTIYANGDVAFSGSVGANPVGELVRINQSTPSRRSISYDVRNALSRSNVMVQNLTYAMVVNDGSSTLEASSEDGAIANFYATASNAISYDCAVPASAFSMPASISNQRVALLAAGATGASSSRLYSSNYLTLNNSTTPTVATWNVGQGLDIDPFTSGLQAYDNARFVQFDWSGTQGAQFLTSSSATGTFTSQSLPTRTLDPNNEYTSTYTEIADNRTTRVGGPLVSIDAEMYYDRSPSLTSYKVQIDRVGNVLQPVATVPVQSFAFTASLGEANGMPNDFFQRDADISLSNCTQTVNNVSTGPVAIAVRFTSDQRVLWKLAGTSNNVRHIFTPSNSINQERYVRLNTNAGSPTTLLKSGFSDSSTGESFTINVTPGVETMVATYLLNGNTVVESCNTPSLAATTAVTVSSRITSLTGRTTALTTNPTVLRAFSPGEFDGSVTHRFNLDGSIDTRASTNTTPGNTDGTFVAWTGGINWILNPTSAYLEEYSSSAQQPARMTLQNSTNPVLPTGGGSHYFSITLEPGTPTVITLGAI